MPRVSPLSLMGMLLIVAGCSNPYRASEEFSLTQPWEGCTQLEVRTRNGAVQVRVGGGDEVLVSGTKGAAGPTLDEAYSNLEQIIVHAGPDAARPGTFVVQVRFPEALRNRNVSASLDIVLPTACAANIETGNGRIGVQGLTGEVVLATSNGRVEVEDLDGELHAATSNGRISVKRVVGSCVLRTSNGRVQVEDVRGSVDVQTSNGAIEARVAPPADGRVKLRTSNGRIRLSLPEGLAADLRLRTSNGRIHTELGDATLRHVDADRSSFQAEVNGGGGEVVAVTSNGSITVQCR